MSALFRIPVSSPTPTIATVPPTMEPFSHRSVSSDRSIQVPTIASHMSPSLQRSDATTSALIPLYHHQQHPSLPQGAPPPMLLPQGALVPSTPSHVTPTFEPSSHTPSSPEYAVYIPTTSPLILPAYESSSPSPVSRGVPTIISTSTAPSPRTTSPVLLARLGPSPRSSPDQRLAVPGSYDEPSFSGSQLLPAGFVESVLSQLHHDQYERGLPQPQQQQHLEELMSAFGPGPVEEAEPHGGREPAGREVHPLVPVPVPPPPLAPAHSRVPVSCESSLSEDELNAARARQGHEGAEFLSPQTVPAVLVRVFRTVSKLSDQDVPGTESGSSSGDPHVVPGSRIISHKRHKEGVVPLLSSRRLRVLKHWEVQRTKVR